ncbi:MAG: hypothetical protein WC586_06305 [Methanoregula sp.]
MIMKQACLFTIIAALLLCCICLPVNAAILEVTVKGTVSGISPGTNTITIDNPQKYGCSFSPGSAPACSFSPMSVSNLSGIAPDAVVSSLFKPGDPVIATSLGGAGGNWITLAKLYGTPPDNGYANIIVGNPSSITTPLVAGYAVEATTVPDCAACAGTTCTAKSASVKVKRNGAVVREGSLLPGQELRYDTASGSTDGSSADVVFRSGKASSATCPGMSSMPGPQAISVFEITVTPPAGYMPTPMPSGTTVPTRAAPVTYVESGMLPLAAILAAGLAGLVLVLRKR